VILVGSATVAGWFFTDALVRVMTTLGSGDQKRSPATVELTQELVRIVLPAVLFLALGSVFSAVLYSVGNPSGAATALAAENLAVVVAILALSGRYGIESMAYGVLAGGVLVAVVQIPWLMRNHALPRPNLHFTDPAVRHIGRLYLPVFLGLIVSTVQVVIDRNLAWRAEADALGAMRYATTLVQSVLGLVAAAISLAALPLLAGHFANRDEERFQATLIHAVRMVSVLVIPAVFGLAAIARPVVVLLFEHGETTSSDASSIAKVLLAYLPGTLFAAYDQILIYMFYARRSTWIPVLVGMGSVGAYFISAWLLAERYGAVGLAISNSVQFVMHTLVLGWIARRTVTQVLRATSGSLATILAASTACGFAAWLTYRALSGSVTGRIGEVILVIAPMAIGAGIYATWVLAAGIPESRALINRAVGTDVRDEPP
jgi:putative peptidoglycan lipid II flippase